MKKRLLLSLVCALVVLCNSFTASAATLTQKEGGQEYFKWNTPSFTNNFMAKASSIKDFIFQIQWSIESSAFTVPSSSVDITCRGDVMNINTNELMSSYNGNTYTVELRRQSFPWTVKSVTFTVGSEQTKTITGLSAGSQYTVKIMNQSMSLSGYNYLVGNGTIE